MTTETKTTNTNPKFHTEPMEGYKAFDKNLRCRNNFQYEVGKTYTMDEESEIYDHGFYFCKNIADCYNYYDFGSRICKVRAEGLIIGDNKNDFDQSGMYCTNQITILEEVTDESLLHANADGSAVGYANTGDCNTGNRNTGYGNTGDRNTGNWNTGGWNTGDGNTGYGNTGYKNTGGWNTGDGNTGYSNTGNCNTGDGNTGNWNTGNCNTGDGNTGYRNTGDWNTGNCNTGDRNTGNWNTGYRNTGDRNTGDWNTGNWNTGYRNTGDFNTCDYSAGCFCTVKPTIRLFNEESDWTYDEWNRSDACRVLRHMPTPWTEITWIDSDDMTDKEKEKHPEYETTGCYLKTIKHNQSRQVWWNKLSDEDKQTVMSLPNFDADIFKECTGIDVNEK